MFIYQFIGIRGSRGRKSAGFRLGKGRGPYGGNLEKFPLRLADIDINQSYSFIQDAFRRPVLS